MPSQAAQGAEPGNARSGADAGKHRVDSPTWADAAGDDLNVLDIGDSLLKHWKLLAGLPVGVALLVAVYSLTLSPVYEATTTFLSEPGSDSRRASVSGLAQIATQLGLASSANTATRLYTTVLESRSLQEQVLQTRFPDPTTATPADSATLFEIVGISGESHAERLENGRNWLSRVMSVTLDAPANVISVSVRHGDPGLAADIANALVSMVSRFNMETRQSNARELRRFVEERVTAAERELFEAEEALKSFLERNREYRGAPELEFQVQRLERQVTIKQEVVITLRRQYEDARIQEVNDTPIISVIDQAVPPQHRVSPRRKRMVILALFIGAVLAVSVAFAFEYLQRTRLKHESDFQRLASRWGQIRAELNSVFAVRRRLSS